MQWRRRGGGGVVVVPEEEGWWMTIKNTYKYKPDPCKSSLDGSADKLSASKKKCTRRGVRRRRRSRRRCTSRVSVIWWDCCWTAGQQRRRRGLTEYSKEPKTRGRRQTMNRCSGGQRLSLGIGQGSSKTVIIITLVDATTERPTTEYKWGAMSRQRTTALSGVWCTAEEDKSKGILWWINAEKRIQLVSWDGSKYSTLYTLHAL